MQTQSSGETFFWYYIKENEERLRIKRSSVRIWPWPLRWVLGQGSLLPLSQGEAFTLASISYLAILVKYNYTGKKKKKKKKKAPSVSPSLSSPALGSGSGCGALSRLRISSSVRWASESSISRYSTWQQKSYKTSHDCWHRASNPNTSAFFHTRQKQNNWRPNWKIQMSTLTNKFYKFPKATGAWEPPVLCDGQQQEQ